ncbi:MAG: hypothetical protein ACI3Y7_08190, partial [Candidatus Cryptobacteroides sp.]
CRFSEHLIEVIQSGVLFLYYRRDTIPEPSPHFAFARGDGLILILSEARSQLSFRAKHEVRSREIYKYQQLY